MSAAADVARSLGGGRSKGNGFLRRCLLGSHVQGSGGNNPSLMIGDGARRWADAWREVRILRPPVTGDDWNYARLA